MERNSELRDFLRSRRARLSPEDPGVPTTGGSRRVPGLRRAELAGLAGVSADYYARLEQGRHMNVSHAVLEAVSGALRLDAVERAYLFELSSPKPLHAARLRPQRVRSSVRSVLRMLDDRSPALVLGHRMDVLASNRLARALITDFDGLPHRERNLLRFMFLDRAARERYVRWDTDAAVMVAALRMEAGRNPNDRLLHELVDELGSKSSEFSRWWAKHDVREYTHGVKRYHHPLVGEMTLPFEKVAFPDEDSQTMCVYAGEPDSSSQAALRRLAELSGTAGAAGTRLKGNDT